MVLDGRPFGAAGAYEKLAGILRFAVDPAHPANQSVTDVGLAPQNASGLVESWADFYLLVPADPARGNRRLLLDVPNRGRKVALGMFNSTPRVPDPSNTPAGGGSAPGKSRGPPPPAPTPPLVGLGFLAVRDTAAWLRFASATAGNPCAGVLERVYAFGVSQSGRFLRHLLYLGLNEAETGRPVFDAVIPHVAGARRGEFNHRFGQPSLNATNAVGSLFPFTDTVETDPVTGERGALLARLEARGALPKILTINTSAEYWRGDASLVHTDVAGMRDVEPHRATRIYLFAGTQHTPGTVPPPDADPNTGGRGREPFNVVDYPPLLRATLVSLDRRVTEVVESPASNAPRLADGTAVLAEVTAGVFTKIPGVRFPDRIDRPVRLDFGPELARGIVTELPPNVGAPFVTFVSAVDADGNEIGGVRPVELLGPLATFTGWNPRHPDQGAPGDLMSMMGSTLPFPRTRAERLAKGDPRRSVEERYPSRAAYLEKVRTAALALVAARHMLAEDLDAIVELAERVWDWVLARVT